MATLPQDAREPRARILREEYCLWPDYPEGRSPAISRSIETCRGTSRRASRHNRKFPSGKAEKSGNVGKIGARSMNQSKSGAPRDARRPCRTIRSATRGRWRITTGVIPEVDVPVRVETAVRGYASPDDCGCRNPVKLADTGETNDPPVKPLIPRTISGEARVEIAAAEPYFRRGRNYTRVRLCLKYRITHFSRGLPAPDRPRVLSLALIPMTLSLVSDRHSA